jgi:hypothetical protein
MGVLIIKVKEVFGSECCLCCYTHGTNSHMAGKKSLALRAKLQIGSLREAIGGADKDKEKTGRKNMVVFNAHSGKYEPIQKKLLKAHANSTKNKSNKAMTEGRKKMMEKKKPARVIDIDKVKRESKNH